MPLLTSKQPDSPNGTKPTAKKMSALYNGLANYQSAQNRWIPLSLMVLLIVNLLAQCSTQNEISKVQRQEKYAFLQKTDGDTERIEQINATERSVPNLKKFAYDWTKTCFTWTGVLDGKPDPGISQQRRKYPTKFYNCAIAISPDFRQLYLNGLYDLYADHPSFRNQLSLSSFVSGTHFAKHEVQIYVQPLEPQKVGEGLWDIPVVSTREFRSNGQPYAVEKFNQTLRLKAIPPYSNPWSDDQTPFGKLLDQWQLQGLQIVQVTRMPG